jgi:biotin carboxyl carrier protein
MRFQEGAREYVVQVTHATGDRHAYEVRIDGEPVDGEGAVPLLLAQRGDEVTLRYGSSVFRCEVAHAREDGEVLVAWQGRSYRLTTPRPPDVDVAAHGAQAQAGSQQLLAPMAGTIIKVNVREGERVEQHQTLVVLGAMKMEHAITAPYAAAVRRVSHAAGDVVPGGEPLIELEASAARDADQEVS